MSRMTLAQGSYFRRLVLRLELFYLDLSFRNAHHTAVGLMITKQWAYSAMRYLN